MALFYFCSLSVTLCSENVPNQFKMASTIVVSPKIGFGIDVFCLLKHILHSFSVDTCYSFSYVSQI